MLLKRLTAHIHTNMCFIPLLISAQCLFKVLANVLIPKKAYEATGQIALLGWGSTIVKATLAPSFVLSLSVRFLVLELDHCNPCIKQNDFSLHNVSCSQRKITVSNFFVLIMGHITRHCILWIMMPEVRCLDNGKFYTEIRHFLFVIVICINNLKFVIQ